MFAHADGQRRRSACRAGLRTLGECTNVFNALVSLSDERQPQTATPQDVDPDTPAEREPEEEIVNEDGGAATAEQLLYSSDEAVPVEESSPLVADDSIEQTSLEFNPAAADVSQIFIEPPIRDDEVTGTYESIVLGARESVPAGLEETAEEVDKSADEELNQQLQSLAARIEAARQNELAQTHTGIRPIFVEPPPQAPPELEAPRPRTALPARGRRRRARAAAHPPDPQPLSRRPRRQSASASAAHRALRFPRGEAHAALGRGRL